MKKPKKFDLDKELDHIGGWSAYGGVWKRYNGTAGTPTPDCTAENPCLRTGWLTFGAEDQVASEHVEYAVSNGHAVITQGLDDPFRARLFAVAPDLLRFIRRIADGEASTLGVVAEAKALVKTVREPVHVHGRHDATTGFLDPEDWLND